MTPMIRQAARRLTRSPVFTAAAIASLAIGTGLSTATFAVVDSMLHPKIAIAGVDRLFRVSLRLGNQATPPSLVERVRALQELPGIERVAVATGGFTVSVVANGVQSWLGLETTTPDFLRTVGVAPAMGRFPASDEARAGTAVVLTASAWRRLFPKRVGLEGARISIAARQYDVVGVLAPGLESLMYGDVWLPATSVVNLEGLRDTRVFVRLAAGTDSMAIRPQLALAAARLTAAYVEPGVPAYQLRLTGVRPKAASFRDNELAVLMAGLALGTILIAATNVTALALSRSLARRRDHAVRATLGASRRRIGAEVLSEFALLGLLGIVLGLMIAFALTGALTHLIPVEFTQRGYFMPELNLRVFAIGSVAAALGILAAGALPAWQAGRLDISGPMKDASGASTSRSRNEFKLLVVGQLAVATVLLVLANLLTLSTRRLINYDFGFDARRLLSARVDVLSSAAPGAAPRADADLLDAAVQRARAVPGIVAVTTQGFGLAEGGGVTGDAGGRVASIRTLGYVEAGPRFFETLGIPLADGRDFTAGDGRIGAVVLSTSAAARMFPHCDAIGRSVKLGAERSSSAWYPVIGIAADVRLGLPDAVDDQSNIVIYASTAARSIVNSHLVVRPSNIDPKLKLDVLAALHDAMPAGAATQVGPFVEYYDTFVRRQQFYQRLFTTLSGAAMLLGIIGLFSVVSYSVSLRIREFAVRQALGASPRMVFRIVLREAAELALGGTAVGALLSFWASAGLSSVLFGVKNTDAASLVAAEAVLIAATLLAVLLPAYRAMRAAPIDVLRAT